MKTFSAMLASSVVEYYGKYNVNEEGKYMEFVSFMSFSMMEYISVIIGILALYRFKIHHHLAPALVISVICSFLSHALCFKYQMREIAPTIQLGVFIVLFWLMFRVRFLYSLLMGGTYFLAYVALQSLILLVLSRFPWFDPIHIDQIDSAQMYTLQLVSSIVNLLIAFYLQRRRLGFTFIPTSEQERYEWSNRGTQLIALIVFGICLVSITYYFYITTHLISMLVITVLLVIVGVLYYSKAKEYEE